jgi:hypothetical protein
VRNLIEETNMAATIGNRPRAFKPI